MEQPAAQDPLIGAQVGNYTVVRKLGEGGMGAVYLAEHPMIGKKVALKVLHQEFASNEDVVGRFFNEAKAVNDIQHPNIVDIIDYGKIPRTIDRSEVVYFIMEFLGGRSLAQLIRDEAPLAPERALHICLQIADALCASHRAGIVHRDLKPDNVILVKRGHEQDFCKVLDFGIAKLTGDQKGSRRTRTGIVMGTPAYMSPEQCEGRGEVDHRTDVYALGILLYECLTAQVPFQGEGYGEILVQHLTQPPRPPSTIRGIAPHVEQVCLKALEKKPANRYPNMAEMMKAMADPVGYVEALGGLHGFLARDLGPASPEQDAPFSPLRGSASTFPVSSLQTPVHPSVSPPGGYYPPTPPPGSYVTPVPGMVMPTPPPGNYAAPVPGAPTTPGPGTLSPTGAATPMAAVSYAPHQAAGGGSVLKWVAIAGVVAVAGVIALFVAMSGDGEPTPAGGTAAAGATTEGEPDQNAAADQKAAADRKAAEDKKAAEDQKAADDQKAAADKKAAAATPDAGATPAVEMVELSLLSTPEGAKVFLGDSKEPVGTTPLTRSIPKQETPLKIRFVKEGFQEVVKEKKSVLVAQEVEVELKPIKKRERDRDRRKAGSTDRKSGGGIDDDDFTILREDDTPKKKK